jgi:hypothetical protein
MVDSISMVFKPAFMKSIINSDVGASGHTYELTISHRDTIKHKACFISETVL